MLQTQRNAGSLGILRNSIPGETLLIGGGVCFVLFWFFFKLKQFLNYTIEKSTLKDVFPRDILWKLSLDHQNLTHDLIHAIWKGDSSVEGYDQ